ILNVYCTKYESGGKIWPVVHNTTVFSLVLAQIIALGVFGLKDSPIASGFTIPLLVCTLLFNEYCRQRFSPIFESFSAQDLIEMDREDERKGRLDEVLQKLPLAYCQHVTKARDESERSRSESSAVSIQCLDIHESFSHSSVGRLPVSALQQIAQVVKTGRETEVEF
ncbi:CSC1-like protein, partial [Nymphaea thermarum]